MAERSIEQLRLARTWRRVHQRHDKALRHPRECQPACANHRIHYGNPDTDTYCYNDSDATPTATASATATATATATAAATATATATATPTSTPTATATPTAFSHPLLFPPVTTDANVSVGIDEVCIPILDGPCTNMWTYGGTFPGLTIRRPTGQMTHVTLQTTSTQVRAP